MGQEGEHKITFNKNICGGSTISLEELEKEITEQELKVVIGGLANEKSPRPDRFPILFYSKYRRIIREDMMDLIKELIGAQQD